MKKLFIISALALGISGCSDEPVKEEQVKQMFDIVLNKTETCMSDMVKQAGGSASDGEQAMTMVRGMITAKIPSVYEKLKEKKVSSADFGACIKSLESAMSSVSCDDMMKNSKPPVLEECKALESMGNPFK